MNEPTDPKLKNLLAQWKVSEALPPRFQENVWRRIESSEAVQGRSLLEDLKLLAERLFARPAMAFSYITILLAIGLTTGYLKAQERNNRFESQMAARYVQAIDPYQRTAE